MKKNKIILGSVAGAVALLGMGAFAFFSDSVDQDTQGTVGTVDVGAVGDLALSNNGNINPGDEQTPYDPENPGNTTPHALTFGVKNEGTKSIRTRNIIDIIVDSAADPSENLDPTKFALYEKDEDEPFENTELSLLTDLEVTKFVYEKDGKQILRYIIEGASLNGEVGKLEDSDVVAGDVNRDSVVADDAVNSVAYDYYLGLASDTLDAYQGATVTINLTVQAMQYRNTTGNDVDGNWTDVLTDTIVSAPAGN